MTAWTTRDDALHSPKAPKRLRGSSRLCASEENRSDHQLAHCRRTFGPRWPFLYRRLSRKAMGGSLSRFRFAGLRPTNGSPSPAFGPRSAFPTPCSPNITDTSLPTAVIPSCASYALNCGKRNAKAAPRRRLRLNIPRTNRARWDACNASPSPLT
jgi:hypothetical protein